MPTWIDNFSNFYEWRCSVKIFNYFAKKIAQYRSTDTGQGNIPGSSCLYNPSKVKCSLVDYIGCTRKKQNNTWQLICPFQKWALASAVKATAINPICA